MVFPDAGLKVHILNSDPVLSSDPRKSASPSRETESRHKQRRDWIFQQPASNAKSQPLHRPVLRVLLVEDDDVDARIVTVFSALIEMYDFDLKRVRSIVDARRALEDFDFDVCLLDYWVGHESSLKVLSTIEQRSPKVPTVVLSNISRMDVDALRLQSGGTCFLSKASCTPKSLENAVQKVLRAGSSLFQGAHRVGPSPAMV